MLEKYGVANYLNSIEEKIFAVNYSTKDVFNISWGYEIYWVLIWALGLIDDISNATNICDCQKAVGFVQTCETYEQFRNKCRLRDIEEILDMLDLYYRFHWAVTEKRINSETEISDLNPEVVLERRRGLEWLVSEEKDWYNIVLNT